MPRGPLPSILVVPYTSLASAAADAREYRGGVRTMRRTSIFAISVAVVLGATLTCTAFADNEFEVSVSKGKVTVTAHTGWHINKDYPWKLVVGDAKLDKSSFHLAATTATGSDAPQG